MSAGEDTGRGIVAAGHPLTAGAADEILRAGGNAFDAALAALVTACATEPVMASPAAAGFLLALPVEGKPRVYDFFAQTPAQRRPEAEIEFNPIIADFGEAQQEFHIGLGTVAVPGMVKGLFAAHGDLGALPIAEIMAPAITLARGGVTITPFQAYLFGVIGPTFLSTKACRAIFGSPNGEGLVGEGEILRQPELADVLEALSREGAALFYEGEIAGQIARDMAGTPGGHITAADLAAYQVILREPLSFEYRRARIHTNPPPASGGLMAAFGLKLLEGRDVAAFPFGSADHVALIASAIRETGEARLDMAARGEGTGEAGEAMLDAEFLDIYRARLTGRPRARRGTTQISVIDGAGNLASLTVSNGEGSGYVVPGTGIVMNNMLGEEDLNPGGFHRWPTARRMASMMAPTAVEWPAGAGPGAVAGRKVATGSGGSNRIRSALLQVLVNLIDYGMPLDQAVSAPRLHVEDGLLSIEGGFELDQLGAVLEACASVQIWDRRNMFFGGAHSVEALTKGGRLSFSGAGDERRGGSVLP